MSEQFGLSRDSFLKPSKRTWMAWIDALTLSKSERLTPTRTRPSSVMSGTPRPVASTAHVSVVIDSPAPTEDVA
jgi:hypothetical protein